MRLRHVLISDPSALPGAAIVWTLIIVRGVLRARDTTVNLG